MKNKFCSGLSGARVFVVVALLWSSKVFSYVNTVQTQSTKPLKAFLGMDRVDYYNSQNLSDGFLSLSLESQTQVFKGSLNLVTPLSNSNQSFSFHMPEAYFKMKYGFSLGRKLMSWTTDEELKPAGFWNNAWDYNRAQPELEGSFGLFYDLKVSASSSFSFVASPVSVPKWVSHQNFEEDGRVEASTPWFRPPPEEITYSSETFPVNYSLEDLNYISLISRPQIGGTYLFDKSNFQIRTSYFYAPSRDVDLGIDFAIRADQEDLPVEVSLSPEITYVHRFGLDTSYKWSSSSTTNISFNYRERNTSLREDLTLSFIGLSSGGLFLVSHEEKFWTQRLSIKAFAIENTQITNLSTGELDELLKDSLSVQPRFQRGAGLNLSLRLRRDKLEGQVFYDSFQKGLLSNLQYVRALHKKASLRLGFNFVEALGEESTGFYKAYRRNDFVYGGVYYEI